MACKKAYRVVGQTKDQPRFFLRSFDNFVEAAGKGMARTLSGVMYRGRSAGGGSSRHTTSASVPIFLRNSITLCALLMAAAILPTCLTMPASASRCLRCRSMGARAGRMRHSAKT